MKTIIKTIGLAALILLPVSAFSQPSNLPPLIPFPPLEVKGIFIGNTYTKDQVQATLGVPTHYWSGMSEFGLNEEYNYTVNQQNNLFRFAENGVFIEFTIRSSDFPVFSAHSSGGIRVGDNISKVQVFGFGPATKRSDGTYWVAILSDDPLILRVNEAGIITLIMFSTSV